MTSVFSDASARDTASGAAARAAANIKIILRISFSLLFWGSAVSVSESKVGTSREQFRGHRAEDNPKARCGTLEIDLHESAPRWNVVALSENSPICLPFAIYFPPYGCVRFSIRRTSFWRVRGPAVKSRIRGRSVYLPPASAAVLACVQRTKARAGAVQREPHGTTRLVFGRKHDGQHADRLFRVAGSSLP
jgi:hypothetical protein